MIMTQIQENNIFKIGLVLNGMLGLTGNDFRTTSVDTFKDLNAAKIISECMEDILKLRSKLEKKGNDEFTEETPEVEHINKKAEDITRTRKECAKHRVSSTDEPQLVGTLGCHQMLAFEKFYVQLCNLMKFPRSCNSRYFWKWLNTLFNKVVMNVL